MVQVLNKDGIKPKFNKHLKEWSNDLHCIIQSLSKQPQSSDKDKDHANICISILFNNTEHWGAFQCAELGRKENFKKMSNFALPLVILTWHRMLQEFFWANREFTLFELGDYSKQCKKLAAALYDSLYLVSTPSTGTKVTSFNCSRQTQTLCF